MILKLRKELKMTQAQLGEKVGVSGAAISQFEKGLSKPSEESIYMLSEALGYNFRELWSQVSNPAEAGDEFEEIPFYPIGAYPILNSFIDTDIILSPHATPFRNKLPVLSLPDVDYTRACVFEIKGNNMAPRYPHGSRYVIIEVSPKEMKYATGVHLFLRKERPPMLRRIISNKAGLLTLRSDATGEEHILELDELINPIYPGIPQLYKLGQAVHMPPEE
jgi:transcriptional regulator with XRE-family HTH domain